MKTLLMPAFWWVLVFYALGVVQQCRGASASSGSIGVSWGDPSGGLITFTRTGIAPDVSYGTGISGAISIFVDVTPGVTGSGAHTGSPAATHVYTANENASIAGTSNVSISGVTNIWVIAQTFGGAAPGMWSGSGAVLAWTATNKKKINGTFTNTGQTNQRYIIEDGSGNILFDSGVIAVGATVPVNLEYDASLTLVHKVFVPAEFSDGGWVEATITGTPTGDNIGVASTPTPTSTYTPPTAAPTTPTNTITGSPNGPAAAAITPPSQTVWTPTTNTTDNERLDKATYRVGVDKINDKLGEVKTKLTEIKTALTTDTGSTTAPTIPDDPAETVAAGIPAPDVAGVLPDPMEDLFSGTFSSVTAVSASMSIPAFLNIPMTSWDWSYDFAEHETLITVIRNFLKFVLVVEFFLLSTRTVRGALV